MKQQIFTIFDQKAKAYLPPFFLPAAAMAIRTFSDCVNSPDHMFGKHPADYTLIELGSFCDSSAAITVHEIPQVLGTGVEFKISEAKTNGEEQ